MTTIFLTVTLMAVAQNNDYEDGDRDYPNKFVHDSKL